MTAISAEHLRPKVSVNVIPSVDGALLIGVASNDNPKAKGGLLKLTPAALEALPGALAEYFDRTRRAA